MTNKDTILELGSEKLAELLVTFNPINQCWVFPHSMSVAFPYDFGWYGESTFPVKDYCYESVIEEVSKWLNSEV